MEKSKNDSRRLFQFEGLFWRYFEHYDPEIPIIDGPICIVKKCLGPVKKIFARQYKCRLCDKSYSHGREMSDLKKLAREKFKAESRKGLKVVNFDALPSVNEKKVVENKFYSISIEHEESGKMKDIHVIVGDKKKEGKKAHIILSPEGEVRFDKKDLHPSEEIRSVGIINFK